MLFIIVFYIHFYSSTIRPETYNILILCDLQNHNNYQSNLIWKTTTSGEFPVRIGGPQDPKPEET